MEQRDGKTPQNVCTEKEIEYILRQVSPAVFVCRYIFPAHMEARKPSLCKQIRRQSPQSQHKAVTAPLTKGSLSACLARSGVTAGDGRDCVFPQVVKSTAPCNNKTSF